MPVQKIASVVAVLFLFQFIVLSGSASFAADDSAGTSSGEIKDKRHILSETQHISENIMSPYCPGRTLSSCPSPDARSLRNEISLWLERGYSREAVMRQLKGMFGSSIQGSPEAEGFGIVAWTAPFAALLALFFVLLVYLQRSKRKDQNNHFQNRSDSSQTSLES